VNHVDAGSDLRMGASRGRLVWDVPVRLVHWLLVCAVVGCYVTDKLGPSYFRWHVICGCSVLILVVFRILWGFVGTRHARFVSFLRGPRAIWSYLRGRSSNLTNATSVGHNPLGGISVLVLLLLLLTQAATGLFSNDDIDNSGPLYGWVSSQLSDRLTGLHHLAFTLLEIMIGLHLAAVLFYTVVKRSGLIGPMVSGRKPAAEVPVAQEIPGSRLWLALILLILLNAALLYIVKKAPAVSMSPF
jgi:cytochrome b